MGGLSPTIPSSALTPPAASAAATAGGSGGLTLETGALGGGGNADVGGSTLVFAGGRPAGGGPRIDISEGWDITPGSVFISDTLGILLWSGGAPSMLEEVVA